MSYEFSLCSNDTRKSKFKFIVGKEADDKLRITAVEEKGGLYFPKIYLKNFEKIKFSTPRFEMKRVEDIIEEIMSSNKTRKTNFTINNSNINFSFYIFKEFPINLEIPPLTMTNAEESFSSVSSALFTFIQLSKKYNKFIRNFSIRLSKNRTEIQSLFKENNMLKKHLEEYNTILKENIASTQNCVFQSETKMINYLNEISQQMKVIPSDEKISLQRTFIRPIPLGEMRKLSEMKIDKRCKISSKTGVSSVCLLRDGSLVSSTYDGTITIHHPENLERKIRAEGQSNLISSVCGLRSGEFAASCNSLIKIWRIEQNQLILSHTLEGHSEDVYKIIELEDCKLCSCSRDKTIKIWEKITKTYVCIATLKRHNDIVVSLIEVNDYIISCGCKDDKSIRIWNKPKFKFYGTCQNAYCFSTNASSRIRDNSIILGAKEELFLVDVSKPQSQRFKSEIFGQVFSVCVLKNNKDIALIGNDKGKVISFDLILRRIISTFAPHTDRVSCIIEFRDNEILSSSNDGTIKIYF